MADGRLLIDYTEAVVGAGDRVGGDPDRLRARVLDRLGPEATGHAAATISAFSGLVRVADGTGIPIDDGLAAASADIRHELALGELGGARNSAVDHIGPSRFTTVEGPVRQRRRLTAPRRPDADPAAGRARPGPGRQRCPVARDTP